MAGQPPTLSLYRPSFLHKFYNWLDRVSWLPPWLFYLLLLIVPGIVQHIVAWDQGLLPARHFNATLGFSTIWLVEVLIVGHWMYRTAGKYLQEYRPLLKMDDQEYERFQYRFSVIPNWGGFLAFLLGLLVGTATGYAQWQASDEHISFLLPGLRIAEWALSNGVTFMLAYQFIRQLRQMNAIFPKQLAIDLFDLTPVYAFSKYTAVLGLATFVIAYLTSLAFDPLTFSSNMVKFQNYLWVGIILAFFYFSLRGLNKRLVDEKERMMIDVNQRLKGMFERIHARFEVENYQEAVNMEKMLASLKLEQDLIKSIPTWPWPPGLFSALASALILPLVLSIIQLIISKLLSP